jgi:hypothetical protein
MRVNNFSQTAEAETIKFIIPETLKIEIVKVIVYRIKLYNYPNVISDSRTKFPPYHKTPKIAPNPINVPIP